MKNRSLFFILCCFVFIANSQNNATTFGLQYKPIVPASYFNSSKIGFNSAYYTLNLTPRYSNSFGMVIRHKINSTFSIESGLNYTQRNFNLTLKNNMLNINDYTSFGIRSYELPFQLLAYVQTSEYWYVNVAFGFSYNVLASDIFSLGEENQNYYQNTYRKSGGYQAILANIGMEYRTENKGFYYLGVSLHRPLKAIAKVFPEYNDAVNIFNEDNELALDLLGNFVTIDIRYFFAK